MSDENEKTNGDGTNSPATLKNTTALTPPGHRLVDPFDRYLETEEGGTGFLLEGEFLNFNGQTGESTIGKDKRKVGATTSFLVHLYDMAVGWAKIVDNKVVAREIGLVRLGYERLPREALDDFEERTWPWNKQGSKREDPWKKVTMLPMRNMEDDGLAVFGPFADTQRRAIKQFVAKCRRSDRGGKEPVVLLKSRSFKNQSGGLTYVPDFEIVGWEFWDPSNMPEPPPPPIAVALEPPGTPPAKLVAAKPKPSKHDDMDDAIPF